MQAAATTTPQPKQRQRSVPSIATNTAPVLPRTYTKEHAHQMLGVCIRTIQRYRITLGFPKTKKLGPGVEVYLADEIDAWILKRLK